MGVRAINAEFFLNNKHYLDSKLIDTLEKKIVTIDNKNRTIAAQKERIDKLERTISQLKVDKMILKDKVAEYKIENRELKGRIKVMSLELEGKTYTIDELQHSVDDLTKKIDEDIEDVVNKNDELQKQNDELRKEIEILRKQLRLNSTNSSKPSSTDGYFVRPQNMREKSGLRVGGQKGHKIHKSRPHNQCTNVIEKHVCRAPAGAIAAKDDNGTVLYYFTQEIDMKIDTTIIETRYYIDSLYEEPENIIMKKYAINPVIYHPHFISLVLYLNNTGNIALDRLCTMLNEMSGGTINLRPSTIVKWMKKFHKESAQDRHKILDNILKSKLTHVDETGVKVNAKIHWMHVLTNPEYAYFVVTKQRGDEVEGPIAILKEYRGYLDHDHFKKYYRLENCIHVECNAHILRYLKAGYELDGSSECDEMIKLLCTMNNNRKELVSHDTYEFNDNQINEYEKKFIEIAERGIKKYQDENPNTAKKYIPEYVNVFKRLIEYKNEHLMFIRDFSVPFDNNAAERQCRVIKGKKKISGQNKTKENADAFASYLTIAQTCKLQKLNTLKKIEEILSN